jgi:hypothetical protein
MFNSFKQIGVSMAEHRLDSVAQNKPLGQPQMSLDEMAKRAEELSKGLSPQAPVEKKPEEKKQGIWGMGTQRGQLEQLEKENY